MRRTTAALVLSAFPTALAAQRLAVTPIVGSYRTLLDQGRFRFALCSSVDPQPCRFDVVRTRLATAPSAGVKVAMWWGNKGVEVMAATAAPRRVLERRTYESSGERLSADSVRLRAHTITSAARFVMRLPLQPGTAATIGLGPSLTILNGAAYDPANDGGSRYVRPSPLTNATLLGITPSITVQVAVSQRLQMELSVSDYLYSVRSSGYDRWSDVMRSGARLQHDVLLSAGFTLARWP
jgi:hypothetical protein